MLVPCRGPYESRAVFVRYRGIAAWVGEDGVCPETVLATMRSSKLATTPLYMSTAFQVDQDHGQTKDCGDSHAQLGRTRNYCHLDRTIRWLLPQSRKVNSCRRSIPTGFHPIFIILARLHTNAVPLSDRCSPQKGSSAICVLAAVLKTSSQPLPEHSMSSLPAGSCIGQGQCCQQLLGSSYGS